MKKFISIILAFQLLIPGAVFAKNKEQTSVSQPEKSISAKLSNNQKPKASIKGDANYLDPSVYPLIPNGNYAGTLVDSYGNGQTIYFSNVADSTYSSDYMDIKLWYYSQNAY